MKAEASTVDPVDFNDDTPDSTIDILQLNRFIFGSDVMILFVGPATILIF